MSPSPTCKFKDDRRAACAHEPKIVSNALALMTIAGQYASKFHLLRRVFAGGCFLESSAFYNATMFVRSPDLCAGIETQNDWLQKIGNTPCQGDLSNLAACTVCNNYVTPAVTKAKTLSNDTSSCIYFFLLYAAAISNSNGPKNPSTALCILGVQSLTDSKKSFSIVYISVGSVLGLLIGFSAAAFLWLWFRRKRWLVHQNFLDRNKQLLKASMVPNTGAIWFKLEQIMEATNDFSELNVVGEGSFAKVYKGSMADGLEIAVKMLRNTTPEGDSEFLNEVEVIKNVRHRNLVALRGCCVASTEKVGHCRLLVYDLMPNGSLQDYLFGATMPTLTWPQRRKIALGMAKGIAYLHNGVQPAIIHRDIKTSNILLDAELQAKVADFGLAKITEEGISHLTTRIAGTQGYVSPEYALYGQLTEKGDVYSFGVVLLELLSGRRALDMTKESPTEYLITDWAWMLVKGNRSLEVIDSTIRQESLKYIMERFVLVGVLCAHLLVACRPTMSQALKMLEGDEHIPEIPDRPLPLNCDLVYR